MKRSEALSSLSRDHHQGLFAAQRLRRATPETAAEARAGFLDFWSAEGRRHFRAEEEVLLPAFARHVAADHEAILRVLTEHVELRRRADDLARSVDAPVRDLHELGQILAAHIRHEERVLFDLIEKALPPAELEMLGRAVQEHENGS